MGAKQVMAGRKLRAVTAARLPVRSPVRNATRPKLVFLINEDGGQAGGRKSPEGLSRSAGSRKTCV